jgi:hypothetical protein
VTIEEGLAVQGEVLCGKEVKKERAVRAAKKEKKKPACAAGVVSRAGHGFGRVSARSTTRPVHVGYGNFQP